MTETNKAKRKTGAKKSKPATDPNSTLYVAAEPGKSDEQGLADIALAPAAHGLAVAEPFNRGSFGKRGVTETYSAIDDKVKAAQNGDLSQCRAMLASQAISLNSIYTELARRAANNMGEYLGATETYMRLALKAQAQSRATIEALEKLANGREQTVKHVHVDNRGGQAVIADNVNAGGQRNGKIDNQSHATGAAGDGTALLGADPCGNGVPISSREGKGTVPAARRD